MTRGASLTICRNSPELIFSVVALYRRETLIVQTSITGGLLSNTLLVLGSCLIIGAWSKDMDTNNLLDSTRFPIVLTRATVQMLMIALGSIIMPAAWVTWSQGDNEAIVPVSHGAAVVLLILYVCYFWFCYGSHDWITRKGVVKKGILLPAMMALDHYKPSISEQIAKYSKERIAETNKKAKMHPLLALSLIAGAGSAVALCTFYALQSVDVPVKQWHLSRSFIGLVIFPVLLGAVDHTIAACHARRQEMSWTMQATIVSNIRLALFILPVAICIGWGLNIPDMTLSFDGFQIALVFVTVLLASNIFQGDGGHWYGVVLHFCCYKH
jgi:Ca2+:H+ antiporter